MRTLAVWLPSISVLTSSPQTCAVVRNSVTFSASVKSGVGHSTPCQEARTHQAPWLGQLTEWEVFCGPDELV